MKKYLTLAIVLLGLSFNQAIAQNATLNVVLTAVQSIQVNAANEIINLNFNTPSDYTAGKSSGALADHIELTSTGKFTVSVKANGPITSGTAADDIPLTALTVTPAQASSDMTLSNLDLHEMAGTLTTSDQAFIESPDGGTTNAKFNVTYAVAGGSNVINRPAATYTTTVTYTITPN